MEHFAKANDITIHYLDHPGDEPTILLTPGLTANANLFDGLIQAGLSPRFRVLALDLRGRGQTDKPPQGYAMADHAADVVGLMDTLGIKQVVMGGHSFGALLTFYIAAHYPERVTRIVASDAGVSLHPRTRELIQPSLDRMGKVLPSWDAYLEMVKQMPYYHGWWDPTIESYYRADVMINSDGAVQSRLYAAGILEAVDKALDEPWAEIVAQIKQPAILLNALGSFGPPGAPPILPYEQAMETVRALGDCRYVQIPGNHVTMLFGDNAKLIVQSLTEFLSS